MLEETKSETTNSSEVLKLLSLPSKTQIDTFLAKPFQSDLEQGGPNTQFYLGVCYTLGYGVPQNDKEAFQLYKVAATQGHLDGQYNL